MHISIQTVDYRPISMDIQNKYIAINVCNILQNFLYLMDEQI